LSKRAKTAFCFKIFVDWPQITQLHLDEKLLNHQTQKKLEQRDFSPIQHDKEQKEGANLASAICTTKHLLWSFRPVSGTSLACPPWKN
jgi:hypothetical protein